MSDVLLVDGSGFFWRAFHAVPERRRADGTPVNAVAGVASMLLRPIAENANATHVAVFFDTGRPTFRHQIYPEYKANRPPPPPDLLRQASLVRRASAAYGFVAIEQVGLEADDLMASYAVAARDAGHTVTLVSSDKDILQLVGDGIRVYDQMKRKVLRDAEVREKFGVSPEHVVDVQALCGDTVDNVPGVPSIGIKTAAKLVESHGSLEQILAGAPAMVQPRLRDALTKYADQARLSLELVKLKRDAPLPISLDALRVGEHDWERTREFLVEMELPSSLAPRLPPMAA
mgnify:CR=1 FL=1